MAGTAEEMASTAEEAAAAATSASPADGVPARQPEEGGKLPNVPAIKAYKNPEFLNSSLARHIRIMCEVQEPQQRLAEHGVDNYFIFLGSHLVMHPEERRKQLAELELKVKAGGPRDELEGYRAKIRFGKGLEPMDRFYLVAMELADMIARWSHERQGKGLTTFHVCTGGGPGVMEAANRGARMAGAVTLGFGSTRPEWGNMNKYVSPEGAFEFHYFFMRKFWMAYKCMGLLVFPGGYGSLDELFEMLALVSSKKITHNLPIVLVGKEHWKKAINFDYLVECSMLSREMLDLIVYADTAQEAFDHLVQQAEQADMSGENDVVEEAKKRRRVSKVCSGAAT